MSPGRREAWPHLQSLVLPSVSLGLYYVAIISRMTRSSVADVLMADHVRVSRAMGLPRRRILVYVMRNALSPVVTVAAMSFGYMFGLGADRGAGVQYPWPVARAAQRHLPGATTSSSSTWSL